VLTLGSPSGARRSARRRVVSDQAAAPSSARSGFLRNSRRIRSRSVGPYRTGGPPPWPASNAAKPCRLNRATSWATASPERRPAASAASVKHAPSATANTALARATRPAGSALARATRLSSARSPAVSGRSGSFCRWAMARPPGPLRSQSDPASIPPTALNGKAHDN